MGTYFLLLGQIFFISKKAENYSRGREILGKLFPFQVLPFQEYTPIYLHITIPLDSVIVTNKLTHYFTTMMSIINRDKYLRVKVTLENVFLLLELQSN